MPEAGIKRGPGFKKLRVLLNQMEETLDSPSNIEAILSNVALFLADKVVRGILGGRPGGKRLRKNRPATIARKGSSKPLIDTATLVGRIAIQGRRFNGLPAVFVGALKTVSSGDPRRSLGRVAGFAEFGTVTMLPREFLRPVLDKNIGEIRAILIGDLGRKMGVIGPEPF